MICSPWDDDQVEVILRFGLASIVCGSLLAFALDTHYGGVDWDVVGVILIVAGLVAVVYEIVTKGHL